MTFKKIERQGADSGLFISVNQSGLNIPWKQYEKMGEPSNLSIEADVSGKPPYKRFRLIPSKDHGDFHVTIQQEYGDKKKLAKINFKKFQEICLPGYYENTEEPVNGSVYVWKKSLRRNKRNFPIKIDSTKKGLQDYVCKECSTKFRSNDQYIDAICPECGSDNIDLR
jgi:predicted Zn-ribbon and HTH transcriptional regulator